jgi:XTP/dITP diphosphohydrolase
MTSIHFITSNKGKFKEVESVLSPLGHDIYQMKIEYPEVQADTLEEVIFFGLDYLQEEVQGSFLIEDSGLFIEPLGGFPGVYSAYIQRTIGNPGILKLMGDLKDRDAVFKSCFGLYSSHGKPKVVTGECKGTISYEMKGESGFGYDPIFIPEGHERTFAQMSVDEKNSLSHRGRALKALIQALK